MSDDGGFDACECIFNYQTMQRLLSLLRQTQAYCNDNECLSLMRLPGPESRSESIPDYLFIGIAFVAMTLLYLFRPNSLRQGFGGDNTKARNNANGSNDDPPLPPPSFD